ncbi:hypothetical protein HMPREF2822_00720 [Corynebacterium sp. HMSC062E11]|uniref:hypothetical protein n=1 Tax=Corynebacterium sp. HMSC062E11 TaxID=1739326 RepID=UPI0008A38F39|nr:hypothetical protein [Corynebacterium sp. HMSC062E11]MDK6805985.1 hypothetical protein [Corynebacterium aurimucosum]NJJ83984.1 hypothetical protein [Corynebacterium aurimucosum]OFK30059.1 hypothetical protein HMPREF2822_00720 [Corynebacterium sp. HMSC062E11]
MNAIAWTREATETEISEVAGFLNMEIADSILEAAGCTAKNCILNWDEDMGLTPESRRVGGLGPIDTPH